MKGSVECLECFAAGAVKDAKRATDDIEDQAEIVKKCLGMVSEYDMKVPPAYLGGQIYRRIRDMTGNEDPHAEAKKKQNDFLLSRLEMYRPLLETSKHSPLESAVRLSIAGNVIDLGVASLQVNSETIIKTIDLAMEEKFGEGEFDTFSKNLEKAKSILFVTDNCGEVVFDRLLIETIPNHKERVTVLCRGKPILNDATRDDIDYVGITPLVKEVIDNGTDYPGTFLRDSQSALECFKKADMIISKGMGNYESLSGETEYPIHFLFKAKCKVVAKNAGVPLGKFVLQCPRN